MIVFPFSPSFFFPLFFSPVGRKNRFRQPGHLSNIEFFSLPFFPFPSPSPFPPKGEIYGVPFHPSSFFFHPPLLSPRRALLRIDSGNDLPYARASHRLFFSFFPLFLPITTSRHVLPLDIASPDAFLFPPFFPSP